MTQRDEISISELKKEAGSGIKWVGIIELLIRILQFSTTIVLARLLLPEDFGVISIAFIFTQLAYVIFDFGLSSAVIQKKELSVSLYHSLFYFYLVLALILMIIVYFVSLKIGQYFEQVLLGELLKYLSLLFPLYALNVIPQIILTRTMKFKKLSLIQLGASFVYCSAIIIAALQGLGVWSFVIGSVFEQIILLFFLIVFVRWYPSMEFSFENISRLLKFGRNVLASRLNAYTNLNIPNFLIGKILGSVQLGYYSIAFQLVEFPVQRISKNVLKVMFPAFSRIQDDNESYIKLYHKTVYYLAIIVIPIFAGIVLTAPRIIILLYGEKWEAAIIPLQILSAVGLFRSIWMTNSLVFLSKGRPEKELFLHALYSVGLIVSLIFVTPFGINVVAICLSILMFFNLLLGQWQAGKLINVPFTRMISNYFIPVLGVICFVIIDLILEYFYLKHVSPLNGLILLVVFSVLVYWIYLKIVDPQIIQKLKLFIKL